MIDKSDLYIWSVNINIMSTDIEETMEIEINPLNLIKNSSKRIVLFEKNGCKKTPTDNECPILIWSLQKLLNNNSMLKNTRNFKLTRFVDSISDASWFLTECFLINSTLCENSEISTDTITILIKPKSIILYQ